VVRTRQLVNFRQGRPPNLVLFACSRDGDFQEFPPVNIRGMDGKRNKEYIAIRQEMLIEE